MNSPLGALIFALGVIALGALLFWPDRGLYWRWHNIYQRNARVLQEDALKHFQHCVFEKSQPTLTSLAGALDVSVNKVTEVLENLQALNLVEMKGNDFSLTPEGSKYALRIIRAHRVYERYLAEKTGYDEADWHLQAHRLEHKLSLDEVEELAEELGNPTHDPHGSPIPTADGEISFHKNAIPLTQLAQGKTARIVQMEDEPEAVYAQFTAEGLFLGQKIHLVEVSPQRYQFWSEDGEHVLAPLIAKNITVVPIAVEATDEEKLPGQPLTMLKPGEEAQVVGISSRIRGAERRRLMDLGLLPGTVISVEMESAGRNPVAYRIRGAVIALRNIQARNIFVCTQSSDC